MAITKLESTRDFFRIWFFWKRQAVLVFLVIVGVIMFYAYTTTPLYESIAQILVLPKTNESEVISAGIVENRVLPVTKNEISTEMEILGSDPVLRSTVKSFGEKGIDLNIAEKSFVSNISSFISSIPKVLLITLKLKNPSGSRLDRQVSFLRSSLVITPVIDSKIITVTLQAQKPKEAAAVLNKILKFYLAHRNEVYNQQEGIDFYTEQTSKFREKLSHAEDKLHEFQKNWNIVNMGLQNEASIGLLTKLTIELKMLEISYDGGIARTKMLKRNLLDDTQSISLTKEMRAMPIIIELQKGIVPLLVKRSDISRNFTKSSREFQSINSQVKMLQGEIRLEIEKAIKTDELESKSLKIEYESLKKRIAQLVSEANFFNQKQKILQELQSQVDLYRESYILYRGKTETTKVSSDKNNLHISNVNISSTPNIPERPVSPNRFAMLIFSLLFGAFMGVVTPFLLESMDTKLKTIDDIEELLGLPVVCNYSEVSTN